MASTFVVVHVVAAEGVLVARLVGAESALERQAFVGLEFQVESRLKEILVA
jgi:hypothetical protein